MPLGLAGLWGDPDIPRARLTLGLAGFSLGYIRMGILKNALGRGVPIFFERVIAFRLTIKVLQSSVKSVPPLSLYIYIYMDHMVPEVIAGEWMVISPSMTKGSSRCCPEMLRPF